MKKEFNSSPNLLEQFFLDKAKAVDKNCIKVKMFSKSLHVTKIGLLIFGNTPPPLPICSLKIAKCMKEGEVTQTISV